MPQPVRELKFKPDFAKTIDRFEAWWHGQIIDRPPVSLTVDSSRPGQYPAKKTYASERERWLDLEYRLDTHIAWMATQDYPADSFPMFFPNLGPEILAVLYGCDLEFSEHSSWSKPVVHSPEDWQRILATQPDFAHPLWAWIERATDLALEKSDGRYVVGTTDLHGNWDIMAALRDPEALCMDVIDCPDTLVKAGRHVLAGCQEAFRRTWAKIAAYGYGGTSWTAAYHQGSYCIPNCDWWCMVSPEFGRDVVWPDTLAEMSLWERTIYHLDGPDALRHLDTLLECPTLNAVQWVYGAGHGPCTKWIDVYKRIQAAGKGIQLLADTPQNALDTLAQLKPEGVWVCVGQWFKTTGEAEAFIREVERVSKRR